MSEPLGVLFLILFVVAVAACIYLSITMSRRVQAGITRWRDEEKQALEAQLKQFADEDARQQLERWKVDWEEEIRRDAILRSGVVTKGMVTQHIVPYLPGFDLDPKDIRFLGSPVDLIAFKGLNASVEDDVEIVFIEVKTGKSPLSQRERRIKKAVVGKRVSWRIFNPAYLIPMKFRPKGPSAAGYDGTSSWHSASSTGSRSVKLARAPLPAALVRREDRRVFHRRRQQRSGARPALVGSTTRIQAALKSLPDTKRQDWTRSIRA
jgi:predicted Holliday junction resolvase-like endonuclease